MVNFSPRRRSLLLGAFASGVGVAGCAVESTTAAVPASGGSGTLLRPWLTLTGGWLVESASPLQAARPTGRRLNFVQPVGVAARHDIVFVADAGTRTIWRLDRMRDTAAAFAPFAGSVPEAGASMQVGSDMSLFVALPSQHVVVQYDARGVAVRRWGDRLDVPRPVAVAVPENRADVLVGDAGGAVVVFDPLGMPRHFLWGNRPRNLQSIAAMTLGPLGLYVLDRIAQHVVVMDPRGVPLAVIGENELVQPRAMAVDRHGRVFVSNDHDQRIHIFRDQQLLGTYGAAGQGPGRFGRIEALAVDGDLLYVADSATPRVQVMMVAPPSMEQPEGRP